MKKLIIAIMITALSSSAFGLTVKEKYTKKCRAYCTPCMKKCMSLGPVVTEEMDKLYTKKWGFCKESCETILDEKEFPAGCSCNRANVLY